MALCLCLSASVTSQSSIETDQRIERERPSIYPTLRYKEIRVSPIHHDQM